MKVSKDPLRAFAQGDTMGRILTYCECIKTGTKLLAEALVNKRDIDWVEKLIEEEGCKATIDRNHSKDYAQVDIYLYPWIEELRTGLAERGAPKSFFDHWVNGKLFGYSDVEIARYINEHEVKRGSIGGFRAEIERRYQDHPTGCGVDFGEILCFEIHHGDQHEFLDYNASIAKNGIAVGCDFKNLAKKWGISVSFLGQLIAYHCDRLDD